MGIIGIDPGPLQSGVIVLDRENLECPIVDHYIADNGEIISFLEKEGGHNFKSLSYSLAIETIASYGMPVGKDVFVTCIWIGKFIEVWQADYCLVTRQQVKQFLCHSAKAKDANIRQALIDWYGDPGTKKNPGRTYGIVKDQWSALAVATTAAFLPIKRRCFTVNPSVFYEKNK